MIPKGMTSLEANQKLKEIIEVSRVALRHCLKVLDNESLDTLTWDAEYGLRWKMLCADKEDKACWDKTKIFVKPTDIPEPVISAAAKLDFPVNQPPIGKPGKRNKYPDNAGD